MGFSLLLLRVILTLKYEDETRAQFNLCPSFEPNQNFK